MFAAPVASCRAHTALHLVEDKEDVIFVANLSQFLQPFASEMIVAALALNRLDDDGANVDAARLNEAPDFALGLLFARYHIGFALRFRQQKIDVWMLKTRPIVLS